MQMHICYGRCRESFLKNYRPTQSKSDLESEETIMKKGLRRLAAIVLTAAMALSIGAPAFAAEDQGPAGNEMKAINLEFTIPYKTYDEFIQDLEVIEVVETLPEGTPYCNSVREFYEQLYGVESSATTYANMVAEKQLGDLNAVFYATITNNRFVSLNHISSSISPIYLGAEWTQESFTHQFTDLNHVASGDIYGHISNHILTPLGFIKVGTDRYKVPFEISTNEFN